VSHRAEADAEALLSAAQMATLLCSYAGTPTGACLDDDATGSALNDDDDNAPASAPAPPPAPPAPAAPVEPWRIPIDVESTTALLLALSCNAHSVSDAELRPVARGLYPLIAVVNHACAPNAALTFRAPGFAAQLRCCARGGLIAGTEITIAYVDVCATSQERRSALRAGYFFECACERCAAACAQGGSDEDRAMVRARWCDDDAFALHRVAGVLCVCIHVRVCVAADAMRRCVCVLLCDAQGGLGCGACGAALPASGAATCAACGAPASPLPPRAAATAAATARVDAAVAAVKAASSSGDAAAALSAARAAVAAADAAVSSRALPATAAARTRALDALKDAAIACGEWRAACSATEASLEGYFAAHGGEEAAAPLPGLQWATLGRLRWALENAPAAAHAYEKALTCLRASHGRDAPLVTELAHSSREAQAAAAHAAAAEALDS
jgi:hypothetical protein